jgi:hypothetical protein
MKLLLRVLFLLTTFFVLSSGVVMAQAPVPPVLFQGELTIDDVKAPVGTIVVAEVDGIEAATNTPDGIKETGKYMLAVPNEGYAGKMVVFKVNGIVAAESEYISSMDTPVIELDLDVETSASGTSGNTGDSSSGLFGLSPIAIAGIAVGIAAGVVVVVLLVRKRRQE